MCNIHAINYLVILYKICAKGTHTLFTNEEIFLYFFGLFFTPIPPGGPKVRRLTWLRREIIQVLRQAEKVQTEGFAQSSGVAYKDPGKTFVSLFVRGYIKIIGLITLNSDMYDEAVSNPVSHPAAVYPI
jgi:hypothetical protein